ncbi:MAG TPA: hypothetical protein VG694_02135 [Candidatus Paceibacterota bacterium]|nr:hypothetical protein [Candidatus Paceibacterota bacterium]
MPSEDNEKLNKIEDLKKRLSSKSYQPPRGERYDFTYHAPKEVPEAWQSSDSSKGLGRKVLARSSVFKKIFIYSIIFFVLACGYAGYMFFDGGNTVSNNNIDISILGNSFASGGEELPLVVSITNKNSSALQSVDLVVEYPKGSSENGSTDNTERFRQSIGDIPAGSVHNENIKVTLFGEQGSTRDIKVSIEYRVQGSNAIFVKEKDYAVSINSSPINLSVDAPDTITPNQEVTLNIKEVLNATSPSQGLLLKVDYPVGFQFESANPAPSYGNNAWSLGSLSPGAEEDISITGKMVDVFADEQKNFKISSGSQSANDNSSIDVVFDSVAHLITISKPFISAQLYINGQYASEYAAPSSQPISAEIHWANNLYTKIDDLQIVAKVSGNALNRKTINVLDGFYNSVDDTITWDKNFKNGFAEVNPGDSGSVTFTVSPLTSSLGQIITNPVINVDVSISGKQPLEGEAVNQLKSSESKTVNIISDVNLAAKALYYSGAFTNTGPIPPKSAEETTYTVVWDVSNTSNSISNAKVSATLPPWVRFVGQTSPSTENVTYNDSTKTITWNVGSIDKGAGIVGPGREVSFQIGFTPSLSQVGTSPVLVNDATLTGHDDFADTDVTVNKNSLSTRLPNDALFPPNGDRVVE